MPAPAPGQGTRFPRPPQDLVNIVGTAIVINVPQSEPTHVDARIRDRYARYTSDPASGIWRTGGDGVRAKISPFALWRISVGRYGVAVTVTLPRTGEILTFEGNLDTIASDLHRAAARIGVRGDRQGFFWALREFSDQAWRQAAARGVC